MKWYKLQLLRFKNLQKTYLQDKITITLAVPKIPTHNEEHQEWGVAAIIPQGRLAWKRITKDFFSFLPKD